MIGDKTPKILIARSGYGVDDANDRELSFNSAWPLLPIEAEGVFEVNNTLSAPVTIYEHGLGYAPVFKVYYLKNGYFYPTPDSSLSAIGSTCTVDADNLIWRGVYFSATPMNLYWKIYRRPIEKNQDLDNYDLTAATTKEGEQGKLIIAMPNKDTNSSDPRDIAFHSSWKQLIIDSSLYGESDTIDGYYTISIAHNLGYRPMYLSYYKNSNDEWQQIGALDVYRATVTTTSISFKLSVGSWGETAPTLALILFKSTINNA